MIKQHDEHGRPRNLVIRKRQINARGDMALWPATTTGIDGHIRHRVRDWADVGRLYLDGRLTPPDVAAAEAATGKKIEEL